MGTPSGTEADRLRGSQLRIAAASYLSTRSKYELEWHPNATCIDVEVKADEFRKYCSETRCDCTIEALSQLAVAKGLRKGN
jgi:hypothetical protein